MNITSLDYKIPAIVAKVTSMREFVTDSEEKKVDKGWRHKGIKNMPFIYSVRVVLCKRRNLITLHVILLLFDVNLLFTFVISFFFFNFRFVGVTSCGESQSRVSCRISTFIQSAF